MCSPTDKKFIFIGGLHRSGTSLLHEIIRSHPKISGFTNTGVFEDEGQHLQTIFKPAKFFGKPGNFVFDKRAYMDENHPLANSHTAEDLFRQWSRYWDTTCDYLVEKSPPNIIRTRFLQSLFPSACFIILLRHPVAVAYATKKWSGHSNIYSLIKHTLLGYEIFIQDMPHLGCVYVLRYEDFVADPQKFTNDIFRFIGLSSLHITQAVNKNVNAKYFGFWECDRKKVINRVFQGLPSEFEHRANRLGYSLNSVEKLLPVSFLGSQVLQTSARK